MSTTPPDEPTREQGAPAGGYGTGGGYDYGRGGPTINLSALMPTPGNAELVVYILATIVLAIIALAADNFDAHGFAVAFGWITAAYLISRGLAKASRVLER